MLKETRLFEHAEGYGMSPGMHPWSHGRVVRGGGYGNIFAPGRGYIGGVVLRGCAYFGTLRCAECVGCFGMGYHHENEWERTTGDDFRRGVLRTDA